MTVGGRAGADRRRDLPDISVLPVTRWCAPDEVALELTLAPAGVFLGTDRAGGPAVLPAVQPRGVRLGVLGALGPAVLLAHRLLGVGCLLTVTTGRSQAWQPLRSRADARRLTIIDQPGRWPAAAPGPPGTAEGPQVLVVDLSNPPPARLAEAPWSTVVHVAHGVPDRSDFWRQIDVVLLARAGHGKAVARLFGRADTLEGDRLRPGEVAVLSRGATRLVTLSAW